MAASQAQTPIAGTSPEEAAARLLQAQAVARKAMADATTAEVAADAALAKAALGDPAAGPFKGIVNSGDKAAVAETNILARQALSDMADEIAQKLVEGGGERFLLSSGAPPTFDALGAFEFRRSLVDRMLQDASTTSGELLPDQGPADTDRNRRIAPSRVVGLATAGVALSGVNALLGYARTNTSIGGSVIDVGQRPLLVAVAAKLLQSGKRVWIDGGPAPLSATIAEPLHGKLADLSTAIAYARTIIDHHVRLLDSIAPPVQVSGQPDVSDAHAHERFRHQRAKDVLLEAVGAAEMFLQSFLTGDGAHLEKILQQADTQAFLEDGYWVSLAIDGAFGSSIIKEHLFAGWLGGIPLMISATVTASWACYRGRDLQLEDAGSTYIYSGLQNINRLSSHSERPTNSNHTGLAAKLYNK